MSETVVRVTTLEQWKSVLDVWFKQGCKWQIYDKGEYLENTLYFGARYLFLSDVIAQGLDNDNQPFIEYADFMAQQEKKMTIYEVTQEQFDLINQIKKAKTMSLMKGISEHFSSLENISVGNKAILRYIGGDETIEFKVKEQLYRLWRIDSDGDRFYMRINRFGTPDSTNAERNAFTAPLEEIKKWQTPAWEIEAAD